MTSTGEQALHPYWDGGQIVLSALQASKPAAAAAAFHRAIRLMPTEIPAAEKDPSRMPDFYRRLREEQVSDYDRSKGITTYFSYPFTGQDTFAFAAVWGDTGSLEILDSLCGRFGLDEPQPCSADYLRIVATVKEIVAASEVTDIKDVRKLFSPEDRVRLRSVWREMRVAGQLIVETNGPKIFFRRTAPEPVPAPANPVPFRKGMPAAEAYLIDRSVLPTPAAISMSGAPEGFFDRWPLAVPVESPLAKRARRTRTAGALSVGDNVWLQTGFGKRADGSGFVPTEVIASDGSGISSIEMEGGGIRSGPQSDCAISRDWDVNVRIYTPLAEQVLALQLASAPEVRDAMRKFGDKHLRPGSAIKSVHACLATQLLAVTVIDHVFVYSFSGDIATAIRLGDDVRKESLHGSLDTVSTWTEWAYFVQLTLNGDGLFIGTYSGLLLHVNFKGDLLDSWSLHSAPRILHETPEGIVGFTGAQFFRAARGGGPVEYTESAYYPNVEAVGSHIILDTRNGSGVFDLESFTGQKVELSKPRRAAYLVDGRLVMETSASRYSF